MIHTPHHHSQLGTIKLIVNKKAKRYILKVKYGEIIVTVPSVYSLDLVNELLDTHCTEISKIIESQGDNRIREGFTLHSEVANVTVVRAAQMKPSLEIEGNTLKIVLSRSQDETSEHSQAILTKIIEEHLKAQGEKKVLDRLNHWAKEMDVFFRRFKLGNAKTAWGKCDMQRNIAISIYAVLLPDHLLDYLIIHELAHITEMNHSDKFWAIVDKFTDNNAKELSNQLKQYNTSIVQFRKQ